MNSPDGGRAFSITGPYGSGKSSLAVFIDALLRASSDPTRLIATDLLDAVSPETTERLKAGQAALGCLENGFIRALTTADREPVASTVIRAAAAGTRRYGSGPKARTIDRLARDQGSVGNARRIVEALCDLAATAPVVLLIDEFGKNLEAFGQTGRSDADLFLLQQLAEVGQGANALPIFLITLQHLSFDDYASTAGHTQRREWAKIQGRFEDIAYVDTPAQTRTLIGAALTSVASSTERESIKRWSAKQVEYARGFGLPLRDPDEVASAFPLHPATLMVLPELCSRFGQYERTLFSFLTGPEPNALPAFLSKTVWHLNQDPTTFKPESVYDYFIESARTMASVGPSASRWLEIETILRDSQGLSELELRTAKTVAVLNLVSSGGSLRASEALLRWILGPGVIPTLRKLESHGLLTYREFADDYRIWRGSDLDLRSEIEAARRRLQGTPISKLLQSIHPLQPVVAARHSIENHTLRVFARRYLDRHTVGLSSADLDPGYDGILCYLVDPEAQMPALNPNAGLRPVIIAEPTSIGGLETAALELAAILEVLGSAPSISEDWVARQELNERSAAARQVLDAKLVKAFSSIAYWYRVDGGPVRFESSESVSGVLSKICSEVYSETPQIPNEMINRTTLTSQGAKARRILIQAMLTEGETEHLGIEGFGPERAMYDAVLNYLGIHDVVEGEYKFKKPSPDSGIASAWGAIETWFARAREERISLADVVSTLESPPFGMRAGAIPVLMTAALIVHSDQIAIYEHGTFKPSIGVETAERMVANAQFFELRHVASEDGVRGAFVAELLESLGLQSSRRRGSIPGVLAIVGHLVRSVADLPTFAKKTRSLSPQAIDIRKYVMEATEPDQLLFSDIPKALGFKPLLPGAQQSQVPTKQVIDALLAAIEELTSAYSLLLERIRDAVITRTKARTTLDYRSEFEVRARFLEDAVVDPSLRAFVQALGERSFETEDWTSRLGTIVSKIPPANWNNDQWTSFDVRLRGLSEAMLRVEAIIFDPKRESQGFDAVRLTATRSDGVEGAEIVAIDHSQRDAVMRVLDNAISRLTQELGKTADQARAALLAAIATDILPKSGVAENVTPIGDNQNHIATNDGTQHG
ncbi:MAG: hypothetical protein ACT4OM_13110 [Actinomycetota bacterium]